jgi:hypothetical protein
MCAAFSTTSGGQWPGLWGTRGGPPHASFCYRYPSRLLGGLARDPLGGVGDEGLAAFEAAMRDRATPEVLARADELGRSADVREPLRADPDGVANRGDSALPGTRQAKCEGSLERLRLRSTTVQARVPRHQRSVSKAISTVRAFGLPDWRRLLGDKLVVNRQSLLAGLLAKPGGRRRKFGPPSPNCFGHPSAPPLRRLSRPSVSELPAPRAWRQSSRFLLPLGTGCTQRFSERLQCSTLGIHRDSGVNVSRDGDGGMA